MGKKIQTINKTGNPTPNFQKLLVFPKQSKLKSFKTLSSTF